jgi:signal transduction histidine kinase
VQGLGAATALELRGDRWRRLVQLGFRRALAVPMRHRERDLGWMLSLGATTVGYAEDERRAAALVGEQASLALHTGSLLEAERATVDRLTEIDQLKSTFVAAVSHELRTPLTAILGFAELLAEEIEAPMLVAHLDDLRSEGAVLESLIGNLLDTSRLEAGLLRLNLHPIDLTATLRRAIEVVGHGHPSRDVRMFVVDDAGPVVGDGERLRQVFINLIENAAKYSPASGVIDVTVAAEHDSSGTGWIEVTVDDEGPGIPEGDRLRVFERFRRLAADEASPGTGIGLYVVKAVVEAHGGTVTVEDGPQGWGTRFRVRLPTGR